MQITKLISLIFALGVVAAPVTETSAGEGMSKLNLIPQVKVRTNQ